MARLGRRNSKNATAVSRGLTVDERLSLVSGVCNAFDNVEDYEAAWFAHKDELMAACRPFHRPEAFWWIEAKFLPNCAANGYESQRGALLRLGLPLTHAERAILAGSAGSEKTIV
jgi:hypothetical protein